MRPEIDELDRFKNRKSGQAVKAAAKPGPKPVVKAASAEVKGGTSKLLVGMVIVLMAVSGALAWGVWVQEQRVTSLGKELNDAISFISQSKLLIARLEGELSETGEVLEQSGSAAAKKLEFLDSEMRKLWGVSNDRNKKAIAKNNEALSRLESELKSVKSGLDKQLLAVNKSQDALESSYQKLSDRLRALDSKISLTSGEMAITRDAISEDMQALKSEVSAMRAVTDQISENKRAIAAIDSSRRQVNERLVELGRQVNELRLQSGATP